MDIEIGEAGTGSLPEKILAAKAIKAVIFCVCIASIAKILQKSLWFHDFA